MNWRVVFSIARKDIVDAVKNLYILSALIMPIGMSLLLQVAFGNLGNGGKLSLVIYETEKSRLVDNLRGMPDIQLTQVDSEAELLEAVRNATGGLSIPAGFDAAVDAGQQPELVVYSNDSRGGGELAAFKGLVEEQVWQLKGVERPAKVTWNSTGGSRLIATEGQPGELMKHTFLIMLLLMGLAMIGVFIVPYLLMEEKEKHTLDALLVTPAGPGEVALGKALVGLFYATLISIVLVLLNRGWTGNWVFTLAALVLGCLMVVALGLLVGSFLHNMHQVNTLSSLLMVALMLPSWFIIIDAPALAAVSKVIPTYYLADILTLSLPGTATLANTWTNLSILLACVVAVFVGVIWSLRRDRVA